MDAKNAIDARDAGAMLDSIRSESAQQAVTALASVLAQAEARRLLPEMEAERAKQAAAILALEAELPAIDAAAKERDQAFAKARQDLASLPPSTNWQKAEHDAHDAYLAALNKARNAWAAGQHAPEMARRRIDAARNALATLDQKIAALKALAIDADTLRVLGLAK